jgi:hypothetical protein
MGVASDPDRTPGVDAVPASVLRPDHRQAVVPSGSTEQVLVSTMVIWRAERAGGVPAVAGKMAPCSRADPSSGALVGHCHDRNRSFDLSPCLAALVRT